MYGYVVFSWRAKIDEWRPPEGGLCPFDSGGLWHGHLRTHPTLVDEVAKREFFGRHDQSLCEWSKVFGEYLLTNYSHVSDYINGVRPHVGIPEILNAPNSAQAWTWEARVCRDSFRAGRVELQSLYWHRAQWDHFLNWVEIESKYDDSTQERIVEWVQAHAILCSPAESPAKRAAADLLDRFRR